MTDNNLELNLVEVTEDSEEQETIICCNCSGEITEPDTYTQRGESYCEDCFHELFSICERCTDVVPSDDITVVNDTCYCESCFSDECFACSNCGEYHRNRDGISDDNITLCQDCADDYSRCDSCSCLTRDSTYCEDCDECFCSDCYDDHKHAHEIELDEHSDELINNGDNAITDYHPKVNWKFEASEIDNLSDPYFGVELEVEGKKMSTLGNPISNLDVACRIIGTKLYGKAICSHDGSLNHGFEIVFTPHKRQAFKKLKMHDVLKELSKIGIKSFEKATCGLHVHIEKREFFKKIYSREIRSDRSGSVLFQKLFNILEKDITRLSRRKTSQIEKYCKFQNSESDRYSAVNLSNSATVEVRIWRGTLEPTRFKANILFTLAIVDFFKSISKVAIIRGDEQKLLSEFKYWLSSKDEYQSLTTYLKSKRLFGF